MSPITILFAALLVFVNSASIPLSARQASLSPSPSPSLLSLSSQSGSAALSGASEAPASPQSSTSSSPFTSAPSSSPISAEVNEQSAETPSVVLSSSQPVKEAPEVNQPPFVVTSVQAPSTVGNFLGRVGVETPEFRSECLKCCRHSVRDYSNVFPILRSCEPCALNRNLAPGTTGSCAQGALLGFSRTPTACFYDRCHKMLQSRKSSCMCLGGNRR